MEEYIPINKIKVLENIRTRIERTDLGQLMQSINQHGLLQPIGLFKSSDGYVVAYGNRRYQAVKNLGWTKLRVGEDAKILPKELTTEDFIILNTIENINRVDISPVEFGRNCVRLTEMGMSQSEVAAKFNVPKSRVLHSIELYNRVPEQFKESIGYIPSGATKKGKIPASTANAVLNSHLTKKATEELLENVKSKDLSLDEVRVAISLIQDGASVDEAVKKRTDYMIKTVTFTINRSEFEKMQATKFNYFNSFSNFVKSIILGKIPAQPSLIYEIKIKRLQK